MKNIILILITVFFSSQLFSGVEKKNKSEVSFTGIGKYSTEQTIKISGDKKREDSNNDFKGKGITGGLMGKFFIKAKDGGRIINLEEMNVYEMDHKKKKYTVQPIEKISYDSGSEYDEDVEEQEESEEPVSEEPKGESDIEIIKSEFRVTDTGEMQDINKFSCKKYAVLAYTKWRNKRTDETGTDSLFTTVWTTESTDEMQKAREEEEQFNSAYFQAIGIEIDQMRKDILGTNWLAALGQVRSDNQEYHQSYDDAANEMSKIEGFPVVIDGKYYAIRPKPKTEDEAQEETDITDVNKTVGGLAKGLFGKKAKAPEGPEPVFTYYTELKELKVTDINAQDFLVPVKYKLED
jgi:hypothetical protein